MSLRRHRHDPRMIGVEQQGDAVRAQVGLLAEQVHAQFENVLETLRRGLEELDEGEPHV